MRLTTINTRRLLPHTRFNIQPTRHPHTSPFLSALSPLPKSSHIHARHLSDYNPGDPFNTTYTPGPSPQSNTSPQSIQRPRYTKPSSFKAFPEYTLYSQTGTLRFRPMYPTFKRVGQHKEAIALGQRGRLYVEFAPHVDSKTKTDGHFGYATNWKDRIAMALSTEELGTMLVKVPKGDVSYTRNIQTNDMDGLFETPRGKLTKLLEINHSLDENEEECLTWSVDYVRDGQGGQVPPSNYQRSPTKTPIVVTVSMGEWECIRQLIKGSIEDLLGWKSMMGLNLDHLVRNAKDDGENDGVVGGNVGVPF